MALTRAQLGLTGTAADPAISQSFSDVRYGANSPQITVTATGGVLTATLVAPARINVMSNGALQPVNITTNQTLVIPSLATLGNITTCNMRMVLVWLYASNSLGVINPMGGTILNESNSLTSVIISSSSTSNSTVYANSAATGPYKVLGYFESVWTSGTGWATPTAVESGNSSSYALSGIDTIGYGQTWQAVAGNRAINVQYYNTTGKPIVLHARALIITAGNAIVATVNSISLIGSTAQATYGSAITAIIPVNGAYMIPTITGGGSIVEWQELR